MSNPNALAGIGGGPSSSDHGAGGMDHHGLASDHGFLPSNKLERKIMDSSEGFEDEDGNTNGFLKFDDPDMPVFRQQRFGSGVKGVLEDSRNHYAMFALQQRADEARRQEQLRRLSQRHGRLLDQVQETAAQLQEEAAEGEEDDEFEDEEFLRYKLARLRQMQEHTAASAALPTFGALVRLDDVLDYPEAVDKVGSPSTFVVVHLYEDFLPACARMTIHLAALAAKYDQVKFIEACASEAREGFDPAELPLLISYQAGKFIASQSRVGSDRGDKLTPTHVEEVLLKGLGVRLSASQAMRAADTAALQRIHELGLEDKVGACGVAGWRVGRRGAEDSEDEDEDDGRR